MEQKIDIVNLPGACLYLRNKCNVKENRTILEMESFLQFESENEIFYENIFFLQVCLVCSCQNDSNDFKVSLLSMSITLFLKLTAILYAKI